MGKTSTKVKIGVIVSEGSGDRLARVFREFIDLYCKKYSKNKKKIEWFSNDATTKDKFSSYTSLKKLTKESGKRMQKVSLKESKKLRKLYEKWNKKGVEVIFRTSINAEALYDFRLHTSAIKEILVSPQQFLNIGGSKNRASLLLIRDQSQGFYSNDTYQVIQDDKGKPQKIKFQGHFSKKKIKRLIEFAKQQGEKQLNKEKGFEIWMSYKFHLFENIIEQWVKEIDPSIKVYQPDTGFTKLFEYDKAKDLLFIAGNEVGDLMYEPLIEISKNTGSKLELYSKSFILNLPNKDSAGYLCEFQTVHGSADDLEEEKVLPYATLRIASAIIENEFGDEGFTKLMDEALEKVQSKIHDKKIAPTCKTVVDAIKKEIKLLHNKHENGNKSIRLNRSH